MVKAVATLNVTALQKDNVHNQFSSPLRGKYITIFLKLLDAMASAKNI